MLITNARLKGRDGTWDLRVRDGVFAEIVPSAPGAQLDGAYDAGGRLLSPPYVEGHIHLDFANTAGKPRANTSGTLFEAIEIWAERKRAGLNNPDEIRHNALAAVRSAVSHGTGFIRSHVDVTDPELIALKTMLKVRDEVKDWCTVQIVAFPQNGIFAFPGGRELMDTAMQLGADVVGGIPHLEHTREEGAASVSYVFDLAEKYGALVDIHCDEIDDDQSRFLEVMAAETLKRKMQGRVTASHAVAMAYYNPGYMAKLLSKLRAAELGFAICPNENLQLQGHGFSASVPRGVAPVRIVTEWGLSVWAPGKTRSRTRSTRSETATPCGTSTRACMSRTCYRVPGPVPGLCDDQPGAEPWRGVWHRGREAREFHRAGRVDGPASAPAARACPAERAPRPDGP